MRDRMARLRRRRSAPARSRARPASRSARSSTSASAAPTSARGWSGRRCGRSTPQIELRFVANVDPAEIAFALRGPRSRRDPGGGGLQDLHHPGDHDQRRRPPATGCAPRWATAADAPPGGGLRRARRRPRPSACRPTRCSASGLGRRALFGLVGGGPVLRHRPGAGGRSSACWPAPRPWTPTSRPRRWRANAPVLLALAHVFNRNGLGRPVRAVVPYAQRLRLLPTFLQQLEMESNGKRVTPTGRPVAARHRRGGVRRRRHQRASTPSSS